MSDWDAENCQGDPGGLHCYCWYDGEACCWCTAPEMPEENRVEQGMVEGPPRDTKGPE